MCHVVQTGQGQASVLDARGEIFAPETWDGLREDQSARHIHVQTSVGGLVSGVSRHPVGDHPALKPHLLFQHSVEDLGVLAAIAAVDCGRRTHQLAAHRLRN